MTKGEAVKALLVPLEDSIVFPSMTVTLAVDVGDAEQVFLVPEHEGEYSSVGLVADVEDRVRLRGGLRAVTLNGIHRAIIGAARTDNEGR
jgi:ATP-dependent Lon protease